MPPSIHQFTVKDLEGTSIPLARFKDKVLLIVNTASQCGLTPQFEALEALYQEFKADGFEVLAFPSNDFLNQEPLEGDAIQDFCHNHFNITFPVFDKIHVKGEQQHPLFRFLSSKKENGRISAKPRWNFHKYLINQNGEVVDYFYPFTKPTAPKVKRAIGGLLVNYAD